MENRTLISRAYGAFNSRNLNEALILMSENVSWPKASEGGRAQGKAEIRSYWSRQWETFDPRVDVLEIEETAGGKTNVRVHQVVKDLHGAVLFDGEVWHEYTIKDALIERMDIREDENNVGGKQSAAFQQSDN